MSAVVHLGDCLEVMKTLQSGSIDMILCDLPYGTTQNAWDSVLPLDELWKHYERVVKLEGVIVLTAQAPFDKVLAMSNLTLFRYEWIWEKTKSTGFLNANRQPLKAHENILVFYRTQPTYQPQKEPGTPYKGSGGSSKNDNYGSFGGVREGSADGSRFPRSVLRFPHETRPVHPTQKPVALFEYLIRTYTLPGQTVLDNCAGSGTTGVAAIQCNRRAILIEQDAAYYAIAQRRIANAQPALLGAS